MLVRTSAINPIISAMRLMKNVPRPHETFPIRFEQRSLLRVRERRIPFREKTLRGSNLLKGPIGKKSGL